jgi:hypothetical protein
LNTPVLHKSFVQPLGDRAEQAGLSCILVLSWVKAGLPEVLNPCAVTKGQGHMRINRANQPVLTFCAVAASAVVMAASGAHADPPARPLLGPVAAETSQAARANPPLSQTVEVLVKFKDDGLIKDIIDAFWKHPEAARTKFDAFKKGRPGLSSASLVRVTYANELVLAFPLKSAIGTQRLAEARQIAETLQMSPDIAYAEPDHGVQIQDQAPRARPTER